MLRNGRKQRFFSGNSGLLGRNTKAKIIPYAVHHCIFFVKIKGQGRGLTPALPKF